MAKRSNDRKARGIRGALAMLQRLERSNALCDACDPGYDTASEARPMRNILLESLTPILKRGDSEELAGFTLALTGYLGINAAGICPDVSDLRNAFARRLAAERAFAETRDGFQRFMASAGAPRVGP